MDRSTDHQNGHGSTLPATRAAAPEIMELIGGEDAASILIAMLRKLSQAEVTASTANAAANLVSRLVDLGRLGVEIERLRRRHGTTKPLLDD